MMLEEKTDALTAMGISLVAGLEQPGSDAGLGAIVVGLFAVSVLTAFVGLIVIFPLLGHATWHAYRAIRVSRGESVFYWAE